MREEAMSISTPRESCHVLCKDIPCQTDAALRAPFTPPRPPTDLTPNEFDSFRFRSKSLQPQPQQWHGMRHDAQKLTHESVSIVSFRPSLATPGTGTSNASTKTGAASLPPLTPLTPVTPVTPVTPLPSLPPLPSWAKPAKATLPCQKYCTNFCSMSRSWWAQS